MGSHGSREASALCYDTLVLTGAEMSRAAICAVGLFAAACAGAAPAAPADARQVDQVDGAVVRPVPPADLDQRLIQFYPLRGYVLSENGFARMPFTVDARGAVTAPGEALKANHSAYERACRSMLEASTWTPARDARGNAVPYTGTFDCIFEHPNPASWRSTLDISMAPPVQPDYGEDWPARYGYTTHAGTTGAELRIEVSTEGQVSVLGMLKGGDAALAGACSRMIEEGPRWQPAIDKDGQPIRFEGVFSCRVNVDANRTRIRLADVGVAGSLPLDAIASLMTDHLTAFTHCFESAISMSKPVYGRHWLAFEIHADGAIGRVEWVERPVADELLEACVFSAVRGLRFPEAKRTSLADVQFELGGVETIGSRL